jgi:polysaccharide export outer membrane protein
MRTAFLAVVAAFALAGPAQAAGEIAPAMPASVIHTGDKISVAVFGEDQISQEGVFVRRDGFIDLPLAGSVQIAGKTPVAAADQIASVLRRYLKEPHVTVSITQPGQITVLVLGDVKEAGKYSLPTGAHVSEALAAAGGLDITNGAYQAARVALTDGSIKQVPLEALLRRGDQTDNVELTEGTAVYVPGPVQFEVNILGAVDKPGTVILNEGDRLSMAIAKAGNTVNALADLGRVMVTRTEIDGKTASHEVDLYRAVAQGDIRYDPRLRKGDIVYIPKATKAHGVLSTAAFLLHLTGI